MVIFLSKHAAIFEKKKKKKNMLAPAKLRNPGTKRYIFLNYI